jgi:hypothetical protein
MNILIRHLPSGGYSYSEKNFITAVKKTLLLDSNQSILYLVLRGESYLVYIHERRSVLLESIWICVEYVINLVTILNEIKYKSAVH